jgi:hypothetical protein
MSNSSAPRGDGFSFFDVEEGVIKFYRNNHIFLCHFSIPLKIM